MPLSEVRIQRQGLRIVGVTLDGNPVNGADAVTVDYTYGDLTGVTIHLLASRVIEEEQMSERKEQNAV